MGRAVGIDLGTTYSAVASIAAGAPEVIRNSDGDYTTPSVLYFDGDEVTLGVQAENMRVNAEGDVVSLVKRQMGNVDFVFVPDSNDNEYRAEDLSALILSKLVANAEDPMIAARWSAAIAVCDLVDGAATAGVRRNGRLGPQADPVIALALGSAVAGWAVAAKLRRA